MIVHVYNEFTNHALISFSFKIGTERSREATTKNTCNVRWNDEHKENFVNNLKNDVHLLHNIVQEDISADIIVGKFSNIFTDKANVLFKKTSELKNENIFSYSNDTEKT